MPTLVSIPDGLKINKIEFFHEGDGGTEFLDVQFKHNGVGTYHHIRMNSAGWSSDEYENVALAELINSIARHNDNDVSRMTHDEVMEKLKQNVQGLGIDPESVDNIEKALKGEQ